MRLIRLCPFLFAAVVLLAGRQARAEVAAGVDFPLVENHQAAVLVVEPTAGPAVARAAEDLRADLTRVAGVDPELIHSLSTPPPRVLVLAGVLGHSALLDALAASGKLDTKSLAGAWESFLIAVVPHPYPGVDQALVIAGSDARGAIYGLYEISQQIGVSPWHWWADVPVAKKDRLTIPAGTRRFGPPSVKYRGIFLNDEDWGLQPWAAKTFEPETGNIGPKTYAKIFELLLRLKANTLWPAMHPGTAPFNAFPENRRLADKYGIVMGSSHAEPMLRNNVGEWPHERAADYNYVTNRDGVLRYWEQRLAENGRFENIYTLGMRGIHDSNMQGPRTDAERIRTLEQIFADQRGLIARYVRPEVEQVPQMFCAYKEVLDLYRQGLHVPEDVTIVWPDDNFGYVRNFASPAERTRSGSFGVYYHLSYLGRPLSYLWLSTTPPALVWEEMHKAYDYGADRIWIANVGDLKPAELPVSFFLELAWDINRWGPQNLGNFARDWCQRAFGPAHAAAISSLLNDYFLLNFQRRPEHLQWWLPREPRRPSPLTDAEVSERLASFAGLRDRAAALRAKIPAAQQDAYYELVYYPIVGSALANERYFEGERGQLDRARAADKQLTAETRYFNDQLAGGKWRGFMSLEPADDQWSSMRIARWSPPDTPRTSVPAPAPNTFRAANGSEFVANVGRRNFRWTLIPGLGRTGSAMAVLPATGTAIPLAEAAARAPRLDYAFTFPRRGTFVLQAHLLPTHPITGTSLRLAVAVDDSAPQWLEIHDDDGGPAWAQGVLNEVRIATTPLTIAQRGKHTLHVYATDPGVVLDKLVIDLGGMAPSYLGPSGAR